MKRYIYLFFFISQTLISQDILPLRDRAHIIDAIQKDRIQNLLPKLMQEQNLDLWVLITREYNEDPVVIAPNMAQCTKTDNFSFF